MTESDTPISRFVTAIINKITSLISTHNSDSNAHSVILNTKEDINNKVTSWNSTLSDTKYPSEKLVKESIESSKVTIIDNLTTDDATKALSAKQGKALSDMIGESITYINQ